MSASASAPFRIRQSLAPGPRLLLGVGALATLLAPLELWRGVWPPSLLSPVFALIVVGALAVGGVLGFAAVAGPSVTWTISPRAVVIEHRALVYHWRRTLHREDIAAAAVVELTDLDGLPRFAVRLTQVGGEAHDAPAQSIHADAARQLEALRAHLRLAG